MKKIILAAVGVMLAATPALAEHKLLITDVLDQKQIEAQATFEYTHLSADLNSPLLIGRGKQTLNATESNYSLGVGLFHGLEMTASIPYLFSERNSTDFTGVPGEVEKRDGVGDFAIQAKYLLLGGEEEKYAVVTGLDVKFDTAGDAGTGTTDIAPFIAASTNLGHHYIPYAIYRATLRNHDAADTHTLSLGLEKQINDTFTLDGKIDVNFNTATDTTPAYQDFVFELTSYIQLAHNFYLLPSVAYLKATDITTELVKVSNTDGVRVGAALYYLY